MVAAVYQDLAAPRKDLRVTQLGACRLDERVLRDGLCESRQKAQALIMAGSVLVDGHAVTKAGQKVADAADVTLKGDPLPFVSRGGLKLSHALSYFSVDVHDRSAIDIGASTGGFTDVLLTNGAVRVYAVDSGTNQLAWKLRSDPRVIVHEQTSARILTPEQIPETIDLIVCDASFISLKTVLPAPLALAQPEATLITLIKPQFEVGRENVGKKGVVRDPSLHEAVCQTISDWINQQNGWSVIGLTASPILGPEGNKEFLLAAQRSAAPIR
mgnify:CR=1 FL=1